MNAFQAIGINPAKTATSIPSAGLPTYFVLETLSSSPNPLITLSRIMTETLVPSATITATETIQPIIVDDADPGFTREGEDRWECAQGFQGILLWSFTRFDGPDVFVDWMPEVETCSQYQVDVYNPEDFGQAQAITYAVNHLGGLTEIIINQGSHQGEWVSLGEVRSDKLMDRACLTTYVAFDALRLTLLEMCG